MFMKYTGTMGNSLLNMFRQERSDTSLVRMFRVEYDKEYRWAKKAGVNINEDFVKQFLKDTKTGT